MVGELKHREPQSKRFIYKSNVSGGIGTEIG